MKARLHRKKSRKWDLERLETRSLLAGVQITGLGAAGDSLTDEYSETSFLENYQYARNWFQLVVQETGVNAGTSGTNLGEPRRSGYELNWSRYAASSSALLSQGQHTGLANQLNNGKVSHAVLAIGANDFNPSLTSTYSDIYNGKWSSTQINNYSNQVVANVEAALSTLANANNRLVVVNIIDAGTAPKVRSQFPTGSKRDRVSVVIDNINARIATLADKYNVPLADLNGASEYLLGPAKAPLASRQIGGVTITNTAGSAVTNAFVHDGLHPHTIIQAQLANLFLHAFGKYHNTEVDPFTEQEAVTLIGKTYVRDTAGINYDLYVKGWTNALPQLGMIPAQVSYEENSPATLIAPSASVADADNLNYALGTLTVSVSEGGEAQDRLEIRDVGTGPGQISFSKESGWRVYYGGTQIGTFSGGANNVPLSVKFNGAANNAVVQALLRNLTYSSISENPSDAVRTLRFELTDGDGGSAAAESQLLVSRVNDAPVLSFSSADLYFTNYRENANPVVIVPNTSTTTLISFSDADSADFDAGYLEVAIAANADPVDVLGIRNLGTSTGQISTNPAQDVFYEGVKIGSYQGGSEGVPLLINLNGNATVAATKALMRNVTFKTVTESPSIEQRTIRYFVNDGDGGSGSSAPAEVQLNVTSVYDAPTLVGNTSVTYATNSPTAAPLLSDAVVNDLDSPTFGGGRLVVQVTAAVSVTNRLEIGEGFTIVNGEVKLGETTIGNLVSDGVGTAALEIAFTNEATLSVVEQLVRAITFRTDATGNLTNRRVRFQLYDAEGTVGTKYVDVLMQ